MASSSKSAAASAGSAAGSAERVPHRRFNVLTQSWLVCSPHRARRPWNGAVESVERPTLPRYDPKCYLCPGNERVGGARNDAYEATFVFPNDFPALLTPAAASEAESEVTLASTAAVAEGVAAATESASSDVGSDGGGCGDAGAVGGIAPPGESPAEQERGRRSEALRERLLVARPLHGVCRVGCFSPRHDVTLAQMEQKEVEQVVDMWVEMYLSCSSSAAASHAARDCTATGTSGKGTEADASPADKEAFLSHVQIFENKGAMMGCSAPHAHCQMWAMSEIPQEPLREMQGALAYRRAHAGACSLCDYVELETGASEAGARVVHTNASFVVVVPYWALWPFETLVVSRTHASSLLDLSPAQRADLADAVRTIACKYDNLFQVDFPYSMGIHQAPLERGVEQFAAEYCAGDKEEARTLSHLHLHFFPPLLRSATVRKFMVGFEMLAESQRDLTAETAAERLRQCDGTKPLLPQQTQAAAQDGGT